MGVRSLVAALLYLLAIFSDQVRAEQLHSRELTIGDIPVCAVGRRILRRQKAG